MAFQVIWFILWGLLWAVYFMLDGFDLGVGMLHRFLGRNEAEKSAIRRAIGPVWDGNEVWLLTAGGATFAAFPSAYASLFSSLYSALLIGVAFGNIFRGLPLDSQGYHGTLLGLLNPYGLWTGLLFVLLFLVHGSLWLALKTAGDLGERARGFARTGWYFLLAAGLLFLVWAVAAPRA